jgi:hypothetical protein
VGGLVELLLLAAGFTERLRRAVDELTNVDHGEPRGRHPKTKEIRRMKKVLPLLIAALMIPGVALAKGNPNNGGQANHGKAKVQYILKGKLSAYGAYDSGSSTNGSITIDVSHANRHGRALENMQLVFDGMVTSSTKISLADGVTVIADNDQGIVKVRAPREPRSMSGSDLAAILTALPVRQIVDQGASS